MAAGWQNTHTCRESWGPLETSILQQFLQVPTQGYGGAQKLHPWASSKLNNEVTVALSVLVHFSPHLCVIKLHGQWWCSMPSSTRYLPPWNFSKSMYHYRTFRGKLPYRHGQEDVTIEWLNQESHCPVKTMGIDDLRLTESILKTGVLDRFQECLLPMLDFSLCKKLSKLQLRAASGENAVGGNLGSRWSPSGC